MPVLPPNKVEMFAGSAPIPGTRPASAQAAAPVAAEMQLQRRRAAVLTQRDPTVQSCVLSLDALGSLVAERLS